MRTSKPARRGLRHMAGMGIWMMGMIMGAGTVHAQAPDALRNVVHLAASGSVEVDQDWLRMTLQASRDGSDAAAVQKQLQQAVDSALRSLKAQERGQALQVRTGSFGVYPRHGNDGKIKGWQGRAELVVEGQDFARITQAAAEASSMTVGQVAFGLSKEGAERVRGQAQSQAIASFQARAALVAQQFGFSGYTLREVHVNAQEQYGGPRMLRTHAMPAAASMEMADPVPVEAGKAEVEVSVSGSVQLH